MILQKWTKRMQISITWKREKSKQNKNLVFIIIRYLPFPLEKHEFSTNAPMFIFSMEKINQTNNIKWLGPSRIWTHLTDTDTFFPFPNDLIFVVFCWRKQNYGIYSKWVTVEKRRNANADRNDVQMPIENENDNMLYLHFAASIVDLMVVHGRVYTEISLIRIESNTPSKIIYFFVSHTWHW